MNSTLVGVIFPFFFFFNLSGKRVMFSFGCLCFCFVFLFFGSAVGAVSRVIVVPFLFLVLAESVVPFGPAGKGFVLYSLRWSLTFYFMFTKPDALHRLKLFSHCRIGLS